MSTSAKKATATSLQYGALPFRRRADMGTEVMLVTFRRTGRWIIPKGWPMKQESPHAASAREALEEAGVVGEVGTRPIGSYTYQKQLKQGAFVACEVHVFPLEVKRQQRTWPERSKRQVQWFSSADAAAAVQEPALSENSHIPEAAVIQLRWGASSRLIGATRTAGRRTPRLARRPAA